MFIVPVPGRGVLTTTTHSDPFERADQDLNELANDRFTGGRPERLGRVTTAV
ncbi:MAG: hypothetical protein PXZ08_10575 [Actinomycetota bacterium]|nr:hypothetical protein [Actinomycetota bacterium]